MGERKASVSSDVAGPGAAPVCAGLERMRDEAE